jgi:glycosyltransferase involved in cell wall biosynthesis
VALVNSEMSQLQDPLVTVSMPAFNSERYLAEAIQSILDQTYSNFELLILDDGSTDSTRKIIQSFSDSRIVPILCDHNRGLIEARNDIAKRAKGKYIALMDADDKAMPDRLELQVRYLERGIVDICGGSHLSLFEDSGRLKKSKERYTDSDIRALLTVYCPLSNPCVMAKTEVFNELPYKAENRHAEDYCVWIEAAKSGYRFGNLKETLIIYRVHPGQVSVLKKNEAAHVAKLAKQSYLDFLGIEKIRPVPMSFMDRARFAIRFMILLNQKIHGISFVANSEIYSRFQSRKNFFERLISKIEKYFIGLVVTIYGNS